AADFLGYQEPMQQRIFDVVAAFDGTISAEHGIGQKKRDILPAYKAAANLALMRTIKQAIDPSNTMNPNKVVCVD
nr:hydroxyacid dehydrogenase [Alphaproteobacteria bacterium]